MQQQDSVVRFLFEKMGIRGQWIKLSNSWQTVISHHDYAECEQQQLGQALAASALLAETIKFEGSLILQAQGQGPLTAVVAQCTHRRCIRGLARSSGKVPAGDLLKVYGGGRLVLTIEPDNGQPYQGIVQLEGDNLGQALENYYAQSEQLKTRIWLFANAEYAVGLLLQEMPTEQGIETDWRRIEMLAETVTEQELYDLPCQEILYRLFNEETVRVFEANDVRFACRCSTAKIEQTLLSLGRKTLDEMLEENNEISVECEFCNRKYVYDAVDINKLLLDPLTVSNTLTKH